MNSLGFRIDSDWERYQAFRDEFASALDPERYTIAWLDAMVWSGEYLVWSTPNACILCELKRYPTGAVDIHGMLAAGELSEIVETLIPQALAYGRQIGCIGGLIDSREGWAKVLKEKGWQVHQTRLQIALGN